MAAATSSRQPFTRRVAACASAVNVPAASAPVANVRRAPSACRARTCSAWSASTCINSQAPEKARPNLSVKSTRLPIRSTRSACGSICANAPSEGSLMPRGLSMPTTGIPLASSSVSHRMRPARLMLAGPARINGRVAPPSQRRMDAASPSASGITCALAPAASIATSVAPSSASVGRLRCTGPGRPDAARPSARATSGPSAAALADVHAALVTGVAISAWRISWKAPCPS